MTTLRALLEPERAARIAPLDGMRGYAVLLVFLVHHHSLFGQYLAPGGNLFQLSQFLSGIGHSGVDIFFVLSGFLIYGHMLSRPLPYVTFLARRLRRIYPAFLAVFVLYVAACYLVPAASKLPSGPSPTLKYLIENLLLLPGIFAIQPLITVAWSLSYEMAFYLSVPVLISWLKLRRWAPRHRMLLFLSLVVGHCALYQLGLAPHIRISMFIAGMLLYEVVKSQPTSAPEAKREMLAIVFYAAVVIVASLVDTRGDVLRIHPHPANVGYVWWTLALAVAIPILMHSCLPRGGFISRAFSVKPLLWLGRISYSFFLLHGFVLNGVALALRFTSLRFPLSFPQFSILFVANLLLAALASLVLYASVERPLSFSARARVYPAMQAVSPSIPDFSELAMTEAAAD